MKKITIILAFIFIVLFSNKVTYAESILNPYTHPGVMANMKTSVPYKSVRPTTKNAPKDFNQGFKDGCHAGKYTGYPKKVCAYGKKKGYRYTVAIIGDSHSAQWLGAVQTFAEKYNIRILYATKSGCSLSTSPRPDYLTCESWNKLIIPKIIKYKPDVVLTKANNTQTGNTYDFGMIEKFRELNANNIKVFAIRDTPYFNYNVPDCIRKLGRNAEKCKVEKSLIPPTPDWLPILRAEPYIKYVDYTNLICNTKKYCNPTQGNVILTIDRHHLTNSYATTFGNIIFKDIYSFLIEAKKDRTIKENIINT